LSVEQILSLEVALAVFGLLNRVRFWICQSFETTQVAVIWQTVRLSVQKYIMSDAYKSI